jgi:predicted nucleic acid-binding protein
MIKLYWDSCAFISRLQGDADRIDALEYWTDEAAEGRAQIVTSTMAIAEVAFLNRESTEAELEADVRQILDYFRNDYITVLNVTTRIAEDAAAIGRMYGAKPPDAIHIATALFAECAALHTYDGKRMLKLDGKIRPLRGGGAALKIESPTKPDLQRDLKFLSDVSLVRRNPCGPCRMPRGRVIQHGAWLTPSRRIWGRPLSPTTTAHRPASTLKCRR